jgi:peptide/nickel transport system permease protein
MIRFAQHRLALFGGVIVALMIFLALFAPYLSVHDPSEMAVSNRLAPLSSTHPFGTDQFGRDIYSRVIYGSRISVLVGVIAVGLGLSLGVSLGATAGYFGRTVDNVIMRVVDGLEGHYGLPKALLPRLRGAIVGFTLISTRSGVRLRMFGCGRQLATPWIRKPSWMPLPGV